MHADSMTVVSEVALGFPGWWFVSPIIFINSPRALSLSVTVLRSRCSMLELEPDPEHGRVLSRHGLGGRLV